MVKNNREWKTSKLRTLCKFLSGGTPTRSHPEYFEGDIPWITTVALNKFKINEKDATEYITEEAINNSSTKLIPSNSMLFGMRVGVGKISINSVPMCTNQDIMAITNIDAKAFSQVFVLKVIQEYSEYFNNQKRGATIQGIKSDTLREIDIIIPPIELQNEFSSFFHQVDKLKFIIENKKHI